jgi:hypothetical protein
MKKHKLMAKENVEDYAKDLSNVSGIPVAEASKPKSKKSTKSGASVGALLIAAPVVTHPAENELEWTLPTPDDLGALTPDDATDDRIVVITVVQWTGGGQTEPSGGVEIKQFSRVPLITRFINNGKQCNGEIPDGTWDVRVAHLTAQKAGDSYKADTIDSGDGIAWSAWLAGAVFKQPV